MLYLREKQSFTTAKILEVNTKKTKYMLVLHCQKTGQRQSIRTENRSFEEVAKFKYLGITLTNQNFIDEKIKSRLNSGNAFYHSVKSLLSSCLLSKNVEVKIQNHNSTSCFVWV
jgi:hypothetical protein